MKTLEEIKGILSSRKPLIMSRFKVKKISIFGSLVRGENTEPSDIDLLVEFSEPIGLFAFMDLEEYLQEILGAEVDLVSRKALKPRIGEHILREAVPI
ncbi:MAG: nucleotidyltransferase family protein [Deltaproteobacteria bacterium]|nr:nucleotidyltransferase family protein [Deltaproteobacteria bacterium]